MPAKWFLCPDETKIDIDKCLKNHGCQYDNRCAPRPYLRRIAYDQREFTGKISPSSSGNGPRLIYFSGVKDYAIKPESRAFAILGVTSHANLSIHSYTKDVLSEEKLSDEKMQGIADLLDEDEWKEGYFILDDYKTSGSFKVTKWLGIYTEDVPILDKDGNQMRYGKTAKKAGQLKTRKEIKKRDPLVLDVLAEQLQLGRYKAFYEDMGFPISRHRLISIPRDGGTYIAHGRGIDKNLYVIDLPMLPRKTVLDYYENLQAEVDLAIKQKSIRLCNEWECWNGRRCEGYCDVNLSCAEMGRPVQWNGRSR